MAPTTRRQRQEGKSAEESTKISPEEDDVSESSDDDDDDVEEKYAFDGKEYDSYSAMVDAKRKRNYDVLIQSGLMEAVEDMKASSRASRASQRGLRKRRKDKEAQASLPRRKSSRLAGVQADGAYVEDERSGKFTIAGKPSAGQMDDEPEEPSFFNNRINDGSELTVKEAVEHAGTKWVSEDSVTFAENFVHGTLPGLFVAKKSTNRSPTSVVSVNYTSSLRSDLQSISVDDEHSVAKVTPERIYSVACHPSSDILLVGAGDKWGHVGLWNVDHVQDGEEDSNGVHLFKAHNRPVSNLEWTLSGNALMSSSYDGTVRWFDVVSEKFKQVFATYDDAVTYRKELGHGLDEGRSYWVQYCTLDNRNNSDQCFFLSTSVGTAMHVDLRAGKNRLTFHEKLSEKKINTLSLHPDGNTLASAGLDCTVRLWDVRMLKDNRKSRHSKGPKGFATQRCSKSINSAFFSPSGHSLLSTTMANTLELVKDAHLEKNAITSANRIRHDNMTGRWLSTFMAKWHPHNDIFVVGSMQKPRTIEVFDVEGSLLRGVQGEALTAVASRCCFHPSTDHVVLVGGNSSGRVTVAR